MSSKPGAVCGLAFDKRRLKKSLVKCGSGASLGIFQELVMSVSMKAGSVSKSGGPPREERACPIDLHIS